MHTTHKLLGLSLVTAVLVAGCTGTGLPGTTNPDPSQPGFSVTLTKNNAPLANREVFLKTYNSVSEGSYGNSSRVGTTARTDSNGIAFLPAPADAVNNGGLFGVGYDAGAATTATDEVQWFTTPAMNLNTKTGKRASVAFDLGWNLAGFEPANGAVVNGTTVNFRLPEKQGATQYEVLVNKGRVAGSGTQAFNEKGTGRTFTWTGATPGDYAYTGKFFTASGVSGVSAGNQASSPALIFTVSGNQ